MLLNHKKQQNLRAILYVALVCLTVASVMAQTQLTPYQFHDDRQRPAAEADLTIKWIDPPGDRERQISGLTQCVDGRCGSVALDDLVITGKPGGGEQKAEIEVCSAVNAWTDRCDVYDCYEDPVAMMSVCDYLYSYNKSCQIETCTGS